jgi:hypothetical protein
MGKNDMGTSPYKGNWGIFGLQATKRSYEQTLIIAAFAIRVVF